MTTREDDHEKGALARNALYLLLAQVISTGLAVVLNAALGRSLGPAEFGVLFLATSLAGFAYVVVEWGQSQYVVREIAQDPQKEGILLGTTLAVRAAGALAMAGLTALTGWLLGYDARVCALAALTVGMMLPFFMAQGYALVFRARERMEFDAVASVIDRVLTLAVTLLALSLGAGVFGAVAGVGAGGAAALAASVVLLRRMGVPPLSFTSGHARAMMIGGAAISLTNIESSVQPYIDAIVLSKLSPAESMGWYGAARTFVGTLIAPAIILSVAAYPRLSRAAGDTRQLRSELTLVMRPLLALAVLAAVGSFLFAPQAVALVYGTEGFAPAVIILQLLAPGLLLLFIDNMLAAAVVAIDRPRPLVFAKLVNIAACTALAVVLVPAFEASRGNGGMGLAIASGVSEIIMLAAVIVILPAGSLDPALLLAFGQALAAGGATILLFRVLPHLPLAVGMPVCMAAFAALSMALGLVRPAELKALPQLLRRRAAEIPQVL